MYQDGKKTFIYVIKNAIEEDKNEDDAPTRPEMVNPTSPDSIKEDEVTEKKEEDTENKEE